MRIIDLLALARSRFRTGKLRAFLTMLGVIIGVASVVILVSVAQGATKGIGDRLQALGTNLLTVNPGFSATGGANRGQFGTATTLTLADSDAIAKLDNISFVAPQVSSSELVVAGLQNETVSVVGTTSTYADVFAYQVWAGSFLSPLSVEHNMRVAVIGATTADNLGLTDNSIGSTIYIGGLPFDLVGILQPKGGTSNSDDRVLIPLSTARELFVGSNANLSSIGISAKSQSAIDSVSTEITSTLRERHNISATGNADFSVSTQSQLLGTVGSVSDVLTLLLAGIASISLLVGGIGIMNIMLVSVRERTREIGIRKAIGARGRDILTQFLVEALSLSMAGGLIGIGIGVIGSWAIGALAGWGFIFDPITPVAAMSFSLLVGVVFGVWPATQAARLDPVVALRYE
jgi:putative ABC transport system permease protein